ncbi:MAG: hypothetical protein Q8P80_00475, partial [Candidatus Levybacteria bacterium]|nr:hypothetical protein [Candidatus Levybacteria bacterium]
MSIPNISSLPNNSIKGLLVFLIAILVLAAAGSYTVISRNQQGSDKSANQSNQKEQTPSQEAFSPISQNMIVYGTWSENSSNIKTYDLTSGKTYILAKLPSNVK